MIRRFSDLQIRYQFGLIIVLSVALVLVVQTLFYIEVTQVTKRRIELFTHSTITQVLKTTELIFDEASKAALHFSYSHIVQTYLSSDDPLEVFTLSQNIEEMIRTAVEINLELENVVLLDPELKRVYYYNATRMNTALQQIETVLRTNAGMKGYLYVQGDVFEKRDYIAYVMPVLRSIPDARRGEMLGSIVVFLHTDVIRDLIRQAAPADQVELIITDLKNNVVASNIETDAARAVYFEEGDIVIRKSIGNSGWNIEGSIKPAGVVTDYDFFKSFAMAFGLIMILLLALLWWVIHRNFARPVSRMLGEMGKIGDDDYDKVIVTPYRSEIGGIAVHINRMLKKLEMMNGRQLMAQKRVYQMEISRKQTELYALQSQVNPHFLFNTLQSIGGIAFAKDVPEIAWMTVSMADIFKYGIKGEDDVTVRDEIRIVEQYLKIIDIRFSGRFHCEVEVDEEMLDLVMSKMILQPLVENAVYHGLEKRVGQASMRVTGHVQSGSIVFDIRDNGPGIPALELERIKRLLADPTELERSSIDRQKIGIANIQWRIRLKYGEGYGLRIESVPGEGTFVRVRLPRIEK